jgi:hypothetical protein
LPEEDHACIVKKFKANFHAVQKEDSLQVQGEDSDLRFRLHDAVVFLKRQGFALENTFVSYFSSVFNAYINCNLDPVSKQIWIREEEFE